MRLTLFCLVALLPAVSAAAQDAPPSAHPGSTRDFLFGQPRGSASVRGGWVFARGASDLYEFVTDQLTLERGDFDAPAIAAQAGVMLGDRVEAIGGVEWSRSRTDSEYRRFVDDSNLPIAQETRLTNVHLAGSLKVALWPRGRSISRLAWIPRGLTPYIGGGAGAVYYDFVQSGDFVDFVDLSVFTDVFQSKGWAPSAHVFGGADLQVYRMVFLQMEGRYLWSSGKLSRDFIDFDPIDLAGFRMTAGVSVLF